MRNKNKYEVDLTLLDKNDVRVLAFHEIEKNSRVLDVGCACGDFGLILFRNKQCKVTGVDCDNSSLKIAKEKQAYINLKLFNLETQNPSIFSEWDNTFDYITFLDVLEHTKTPLNALIGWLRFLKNDGKVIISLPNIGFGNIKAGILKDNFDYAKTGILDETHVKFFTWKSIAKFLSLAKLEAVKVKTKVSLLNDDVFDGIPEVRNTILENPHSYVYQYVVFCKKSSLSEEELSSLNFKAMSLQWSEVAGVLLKEKIKKIFSNLLMFSPQLKAIIKSLIVNLKSKNLFF